MKKLVKEYEFYNGSGEIFSPELIGIELSQVLLVVNVTANRILYNPTNFDTGAYSLTQGTLNVRLPTDDSLVFNSTDELQIWIDDGESPARDDNLDTLVYFASAIHEKLPVCDTLDRVLANVVGTVTVSGTLTTVTTVTNVTSLNSMQSQPTALAPYNWASGAYHIYNGIEVT
jgi:hypothetical protein